MAGRGIGRMGAALVVALAGLCLGASDASARAFTIVTCQGASKVSPISAGWTTEAFQFHTSSGRMKVVSACNPSTSGQAGLLTGNVKHARRGVRRGDVAFVWMDAPPETSFTSVEWQATVKRGDCRYALQVWAEGPPTQANPTGVTPIRNVRAGCKRRRMPSAYQLDAFHTSTAIPGTTRIVQRVICVGANGRGCSASRSNYILTRLANATVEDASGPSLSVAKDTSLTRGEWVGGSQPLNYDASDNVGVRVAQALVGETQVGTDENRECADGPAANTYYKQVPCKNGRGTIMLETHNVPEGTHSVDVLARDSAGNPSGRVPIEVKVDNTPPARVDLSLEGGEAWRNRNTFTAVWSNPLELDRAPITSAHYTLCRAAGGDCSEADAVGDGISSLTLPVPAPGEWTLSLFRRDAAGNQSRGYASVPVTLRYDPDPPQLMFEPLASADPTRVTVAVTDPLSGPAGGSIEIARESSGLWQALTTDLEAGHLVARIDDASLPAGTYLLRGRAADQAGNESSTDRRVDGQQMVLTLPLRAAARMEAGLALHGSRRHHPVTELRPAGRLRFGHPVRIFGRLTTIDGLGIAGADVQVLARNSAAPEHAVQVVHTGADGRFEYRTTADSSQTIRFLHAGTPTVLPANTEVTVAVPAATSARVRPRQLRNRHAVTFSGRLRGLPPPGGKLVELQVRFPNGWQTFKTIRTDAAGRWSARYRFTRTRGTVRYRFRARLPQEAGYPFETGRSHSVSVRVRGPR